MVTGHHIPVCRGAMVALWLCLLLVNEGETLRGLRFTDLKEDEVAIDRLESYLSSRAHLDSKLQGERKKIPFGIPPSDPKYFVPAEILRGELKHLPRFMKSRLPPPLSPPEDLLSYQNLPMEEGLPMYQDAYSLVDLKEELYPAAHAQYDEAYVKAVAGEQPESQASPSRKEENTTPQAAGESLAGAETSQPEIVHYLQQSRHFVSVPGHHLHLSDVTDAEPLSDFYFVALVSGCTAAAVCAIIGAGICYYRLNKNKRDAADAEYPAYGVTGPNKDLSPGAADRKLAQSAHMYHYQHQKQQMIALEKSAVEEQRGSTSDLDSEEEGEEGDYTVYECPGLAPTGEMEVKNPLFSDDPTPASPTRANTNDHKDDDDEED